MLIPSLGCALFANPFLYVLFGAFTRPFTLIRPSYTVKFTRKEPSCPSSLLAADRIFFIETYNYTMNRVELLSSFVESLLSQDQISVCVPPLIRKFRLFFRVLLLSALFRMTNANSLTTNLVAYYTFDGNANDVSGNNNHGTVHSATLASDRFGTANGAYSFDGSSSYIEISNGTAFNTVDELTISFWIKPQANQKDFAIIFSKSHGPAGWTFEFNGAGATKIYFAYYHTLAVPVVSGISQPIYNEWTHYVIRKQQKSVKVYLNNIVLSSITVSSTTILTNGNLPLTFGAFNAAQTQPASGLNRHFAGLMDEIRIYNRALSEAEITELYVYASPTTQPTAQPSMVPTCQPSNQPSYQPTIQPSTLPTSQPSREPSAQPTSQPSAEPSSQPSMQPSVQPSVQPTMQPSTLPSSQPSNQPNGQPSTVPTTTPSTQPSITSSMQPTANPSSQPSSRPSYQPTSCPTTQPSSAPSSQPSVPPSNQPSQQPIAIPTHQPTSKPSQQRGIWVTPVSYMHSNIRLFHVHGSLWVCGSGANTSCVELDTFDGLPVNEYSFPWTENKDVHGTEVAGRVRLRGRTLNTGGIIDTDIAKCSRNAIDQLSCIARTLYDTHITAMTHVPFANKVIYAGTYATHVLMYIGDASSTDESFNSVDTLIYLFNTMLSVTITHIQSPPVYVGGFFVGTSISSNGMNNYIVAGVVRTDFGSMTAMYFAPAIGIILNSAELVTAMALEYEHPDSFIAGGLELSDGAGMHAYLLRLNAFFGSIKFAVRYQARDGISSTGGRRALSEPSVYTSVANGMVRIGSVLFMLVDVFNRSNAGDTSLTVLQIDMETGLIQQQVHITALNASLSCTDITASTDQLYLYIACNVQYLDTPAQAVVIATNVQLKFAKLPVGFTRHSDAIFTEEFVPFSRFSLPITQKTTTLNTNDYVFTTADGTPTIQPSEQSTYKPSLQPSGDPSSQPSSRPTAAPTVSPQPTSHPSSSGPTNTYKPTVLPTQRPSTVPSKTPTLVPSGPPTIIPTARPSKQPSPMPSTHPSHVITLNPTQLPTTKPTRTPSRLPSVRPTQLPTLSVTAVVGTAAVVRNRGSKSDDAVMIFVYVVAGCLGIWCVYHLVRCAAYVQYYANKKQALRAELGLIQASLAGRSLHHQPRHYTPENPLRGAYIDGPVVPGVSHVVGQDNVVDVTGVPANSTLGSSSSSTSFVLSSLHSSEMSDLSYMVYSEPAGGRTNDIENGSESSDSESSVSGGSQSTENDKQSSSDISVSNIV